LPPIPKQHHASSKTNGNEPLNALRADLDVVPVIKTGQTAHLVRDPRSTFQFELYEVEFQAAKEFNGKTTAAEVSERLAKKGLLLSEKEILRFYRELRGMGFLQPAAAADHISSAPPIEESNPEVAMFLAKAREFVAASQPRMAEEYYRAALAMTPGHEEASDGLRKILEARSIAEGTAQVHRARLTGAVDHQGSFDDDEAMTIVDPMGGMLAGAFGTETEPEIHTASRMQAAVARSSSDKAPPTAFAHPTPVPLPPRKGPSALVSPLPTPVPWAETPTASPSRQRKRRAILATVLSGVTVAALGAGYLFFLHGDSRADEDSAAKPPAEQASADQQSDVTPATAADATRPETATAPPAPDGNRDELSPPASASKPAAATTPAPGDGALVDAVKVQTETVATSVQLKAVLKPSELSRIKASTSGILKKLAKDGSSVRKRARIATITFEKRSRVAPAKTAKLKKKIAEFQGLVKKDPVYKQFLKREQQKLAKLSGGITRRTETVVAPVRGDVSFSSGNGRVRRGDVIASIVDGKLLVANVRVPPRVAKDWTCTVKTSAGDAPCARVKLSKGSKGPRATVYVERARIQSRAGDEITISFEP
jgi:hypothetical protein